MAAGVPLTNEDRWHWLGAIAAWTGERVAVGESDVAQCSALKRAYGEVLPGRASRRAARVPGYRS
jgi:gluconokinase